MNVLITGATGLVGYNLQLNPPPNSSLHTIYSPTEDPLPFALPFPAKPIDITNASAIASLFSSIKPNVVIHTAAQGALDWCEANQSTATLINTASSIHLANLCLKYNAHFIFLSSNAVYDGYHAPYSETDEPHPANHYGQTKLSVEKHLLESSVSHTILRPTLMFGWPSPIGRDNQVTRVIKNLTDKTIVNGVHNSWFNPLYVPSLIQVIWHVATHRITGTFNIGGADRLNLLELSQLTAQVFSLDPSLIKPVSVADSPATAKRPPDTTFRCDRMSKILKISPLPAEEALVAMKTLYD